MAHCAGTHLQVNLLLLFSRLAECLFSRELHLLVPRSQIGIFKSSVHTLQHILLVPQIFEMYKDIKFFGSSRAFCTATKMCSALYIVAMTGIASSREWIFDHARISGLNFFQCQVPDTGSLNELMTLLEILMYVKHILKIITCNN